MSLRILDNVRVLASVRDVAEARLALAAGAHVIDLKEPSAGALGAVSAAIVRDVVGAIDGKALVSATIGDMDLVPQQVLAACSQWADIGVDYIKIGIFPGDLPGTLAALSPLIKQGAKIIAVVFADGQTVWSSVLPLVAEAGFAGIMLDTAGKAGGGLLTHMPLSQCAAFVAAVHDAGLICGLAGSLKPDDIAPLAALNPDYLGFRGALCDAGRAGVLSESKVRDVVGGLAKCRRPGDIKVHSY